MFRRERTGRGGRVSTSLLANGAWANGILIQALLCGATFQPKRPRDLARNALGNLYQSRDGRWSLLTIMREEREWPRLAQGIGRPELLDDPRFASRAARRQHSAALIRILDEVFAGRDWEEWRHVLEASQITSGPVARLADVADDSQMRVIEVIVPVEDGEGPELLTVAGPICIADQPPRRPGPAPLVGEHTDEVLRAAGYDAEAIAQLRARKIVG